MRSLVSKFTSSRSGARAAARTTLLLAACAAGVSALSATAASAASPTATLGVYSGGGNKAGADSFGKWLGRTPTYAEDFIAGTNWSTIESPTWFLNQWKGSSYRLVLSVPMLPDSGATLVTGATGAYNSHWTKLAQTLVANGKSDATIRLGWEMNGDWYSWSIKNGTDNYAAYWRHIVTTMRAVAPNLKFDFTANCGSSSVNGKPLDPAAAYPGDAYVDYIGLDYYDASWINDRKVAMSRWNANRDQKFGLAWHRDFAASHGKPMTFPEWGLSNRPDGYGGGDAPEFITEMTKWIAANNVAYHMYFEFDAPDGEHSLMEGAFPKSAARFRELYGPAAGGDTTPTTPTPTTPTPTTPTPTTPTPTTPTPTTPTPTTPTPTTPTTRTPTTPTTRTPTTTRRTSSNKWWKRSRSSSKSSSTKLRATRASAKSGSRTVVKVVWRGAGSNTALYRDGQRLVGTGSKSSFVDRVATSARVAKYKICSTTTKVCAAQAKVALAS